MTRSGLRSYIELLGETREVRTQPCPECGGEQSEKCQHCDGDGRVMTQEQVAEIAEEIMVRRKPPQRESWQVGWEERAWRRW